MRLPAPVSAAAVRRVVCHGCAAAFETPDAEHVEIVEPSALTAAPASAALSSPEPVPAADAGSATRPPRRAKLLSAPSLPRRPSAPAWLKDPGSRAWRWASIPLAAAAVIGGLLLIQGGGSDESATPFAADAPAVGEPARSGADGPGPQAGNKANGTASLVREASFSLALPAGWERTPASDGATFAAATDTGDADATLWVERDPELTFAGFEANSLDTLEALAGSARVADRTAAPTEEDTIVRLAADSPPGAPTYEVTLRAAGPYRYYLATTVQPDASKEAVDGAELVHGSFQPIAQGSSE